MSFLNITQPGGVPVVLDLSKTSELIVMLHIIRKSFHEANYAQVKFYQAYAKVVNGFRNGRARQEANVPFEITQLEPELYAKTFVYSLDTIRSFLWILAKKANYIEPSTKGKLNNIHQSFDSTFPHLRDIRNTAHHLEDRVRRLGKGGNPISFDEINTGGLIASGALVLANLNGTRYGNALESGGFAEIDVSESNVEALQDLVQQIFYAFNWQGSLPIVTPYG